mgnify:FL=1
MKTSVVKKDAIMLDDHNEVNEMKAFLLDWLIKFGHNPIEWSDTEKLIGGSSTFRLVLRTGEVFITKAEAPIGFRYKLSEKALEFLNG